VATGQEQHLRLTVHADHAGLFVRHALTVLHVLHSAVYLNQGLLLLQFADGQLFEILLEILALLTFPVHVAPLDFELHQYRITVSVLIFEQERFVVRNREHEKAVFVLAMSRLVILHFIRVEN